MITSARIRAMLFATVQRARGCGGVLGIDQLTAPMIMSPLRRNHLRFGLEASTVRCGSSFFSLQSPYRLLRGAGAMTIAAHDDRDRRPAGDLDKRSQSRF
ncbi:MAG: hypothetical protein ACREE9_20270 [Stellaceae bacterium]